MSVKYHIKDDGMPGKCLASSSDKCPKTQSGDSFHGDLVEATKEAERRFEEKLGSFVTASKKEIEETKKAEIAPSEVEVNEKSATTAEYEGELYIHPQGKIIRVDADGNVRAYKGDREVGTSATAEKLRAGYGAWKRYEESAPKVANVQQLKGSYDSAVTELQRTRSELNATMQAHIDYDKRYGEAEGRAHYTDYSEGYAKRKEVRGTNPNGYTSYDPIQAHKDAEQRAFDAWKKAVDDEANAQTALEEAGQGHLIPDDGNTIRVRTQAQKWLLKDELLGQISDGKWENTANNPWQDWSGAKIIVDPKNAGRNFFTSKDNYQLNAADLLEVVGDRMEENVRQKTGNSDYNSKAMYEDLKDLRKIFKTKRPVLGD